MTDEEIERVKVAMLSVPFYPMETHCDRVARAAILALDRPASPPAPAVVVPEGVAKEVHFWLEGALTCKTWEWDGDQRGLAEDALQRLGAALAAAPEPPAAEAPGQEPVAVKGVDSQVMVAATMLDDDQKRNPKWLWHSSANGSLSLGRWQREPSQAPYVRADLVSAPTTYADAEAKGAIEAAARIVQGEPYGSHSGRDGKALYRTWAHWPTLPDGSKGNRGVDDFIVKHCDALADRIRSLASPAPKGET